MDYNLGRFRLNPRGKFDPEVRYDFLDLVYYRGSSYVCVNEQGCYGIIPDSTENSFVYWQCNASKGLDGASGGGTGTGYGNFPVEFIEEEERLNFIDIITDD